MAMTSSPTRKLPPHTGAVDVTEDGRHADPVVDRCARLRALAHGGQRLSQATCDAVDRLPADAALVDLGAHRLREVARHERYYQLSQSNLPQTLLVEQPRTESDRPIARNHEPAWEDPGSRGAPHAGPRPWRFGPCATRSAMWCQWR